MTIQILDHASHIMIENLKSEIRDSRTAARLRQIHQEELADYVALSYCWGGGQQLATKTATIQSYSQELPLGDLSKSIYDAIQTTR
jgi:hypothetical protein